MIYFVQSIDGGPVKIGYSFDVESRIAQLEKHYGKSLAILATMPGGRDEETTIHRRFAHLRCGRTEQFRPAPELMSFIDRPLFVNQGDVELMEPTVKKDNLKAILFTLPADIHRALRVAAAEHEQSMATFARRIIEDYLSGAKAPKSKPKPKPKEGR